MAVLGAGAEVIKSIQRGQTTVISNSQWNQTNTAVTINAVDLNKSFVSVSYANGYGAGNISNSAPSGDTSMIGTSIGGYLASTTSISLQQGKWRRYSTTWSHTGGTAYWEVIEYE